MEPSLLCFSSAPTCFERAEGPRGRDQGHLTPTSGLLAQRWHTANLPQYSGLATFGLQSQERRSPLAGQQQSFPVHHPPALILARPHSLPSQVDSGPT